MTTGRTSVRIHAPHLLSRRRRLGDAFMTGLMWAVYSYLWVPLVSLIAWLLGFEFAYDVMVRSGGIVALKQVLSWYCIMLLCIVLVVTSWSLVNRRRVAGGERRRVAEVVSDTQLAEHFALDADQLYSLRSARISRVSIGASGNIEQVEPVETCDGSA